MDARRIWTATVANLMIGALVGALALGFALFLGHAYGALGIVAASTLVITECSAALVRRWIPIRIKDWCVGREHEVRGDPGAARRRIATVIGLELAISAGVAVLMAVAGARAIGALTGIRVSPELAALLALQLGAYESLLACVQILPKSRRLALAGLAMIAPCLLPLAAFIDPSLDSVVVSSTLGMAGLLIVGAWLAYRGAVRGAEPAEADPRGSLVVSWGSWLYGIHVMPWLVLGVLAGSASIVPIAALWFQLALGVPFMITLTAGLREASTVRRLLWGSIAALVYFGFSYHLGPDLVRWLLPPVFAPAAPLLELTAWHAAALLPLALRAPSLDRKASEAKRALDAAIASALVILAACWLGVEGVLYAAAAARFVSAAIGFDRRPSLERARET